MATPKKKVGAKQKFDDAVVTTLAIPTALMAEIKDRAASIQVEGHLGKPRAMNTAEFIREGARLLCARLAEGSYEPLPAADDREGERPIYDADPMKEKLRRALASEKRAIARRETLERQLAAASEAVS